MNHTSLKAITNATVESRAQADAMLTDVFEDPVIRTRILTALLQWHDLESLKSLLTAIPHLQYSVLLVTDGKGLSDGILALPGVESTLLTEYHRLSYEARNSKTIKIFQFARCHKSIIDGLLSYDPECLYGRHLVDATVVIAQLHGESVFEREILETLTVDSKTLLICKHMLLEDDKGKLLSNEFAEYRCPVKDTLLVGRPAPHFYRRITNRWIPGVVQFYLALPILLSCCSYRWFNTRNISLTYKTNDFSNGHAPIFRADTVKVGTSKFCCFRRGQTDCEYPIITFCALLIFGYLPSIYVEFSGVKTPIVDAFTAAPKTVASFTLVNKNWSTKTPYGSVGTCFHARTSHQDQAHCTDSVENDPMEFTSDVSHITYKGVSDVTLGRTDFRSAISFTWGRLMPKHGPPLPVLIWVIRCRELKSLNITSIVERDPIQRMIEFDAPKLEKLTLISLQQSDIFWDLHTLLTGFPFQNLKQVCLIHEHNSEKDYIPISFTRLKPIASTVEQLLVSGYSPDFLLEKDSFHILREIHIDISSSIQEGQDHVNFEIHPGLAPTLEHLHIILSARATTAGIHRFNLNIPGTIKTFSLDSSLFLSDVILNGIAMEAPCEIVFGWDFVWQQGQDDSQLVFLGTRRRRPLKDPFQSPSTESDASWDLHT